MEFATSRDIDLVTELNDLLRLDHDAVQAYTLATAALQDEGLASTLRQFRRDHERHIAELTPAIQRHGGIALQMPHASGPFKLAVQGVSFVGDDRTVLTAFVANERESRDRYRRAARGSWPEDVGELVRRAAADEERHLAWAERALEQHGGPVGGRAVRRLARIHASTAGAMEDAERGLTRVGERVRRGFIEGDVRTLLATGTVLLAGAFVIGKVLRR
jgi:hypothetical protein